MQTMKKKHFKNTAIHRQCVMGQIPNTFGKIPIHSISYYAMAVGFSASINMYKKTRNIHFKAGDRICKLSHATMSARMVKCRIKSSTSQINISLIQN